MGAALVLLLVGLGALAAGVLIGRYYVPDDRQLRRTARHSRAYMRALSHLIARDHDAAVDELRAVVEENVEDVEPYFALGAMFRSRGEHERAIRVHQALALREHDKRKLRQRAMYELGLDFRAAGMPRRATRAMEEVAVEEPSHEGALRVLAALYEEQARFNEAAGLWQRLGRRRGEDTSHREHHLLVAAGQAALGRDDLDSAKQLLKAAQKHEESAHFFAAAAELAAARGNHRGARERLKQALIAEPALAPHLLPGVIAAEQGLAAEDDGGSRSRAVADELDEEPAPEVAQLAAPASPALPPPQAAGRLALTAAAGAGSGGAAPPAGGAMADAGPAAPPADGAMASGGAAPAATTESAAVAERPGSEAVTERAVAADGQAPGAGTPAAPATTPAAPATTGVLVTTLATTPAGAHAAAGAGAAADPTAGASPVALSATAQQLVATLRSASELAPVAPPEREGVSLVPAHPPPASITERVLAVLAEVEAHSGPRLELALIRAQLVPPTDPAAQARLARELTAQFPESLAARVAASRLAIASSDPAAIRGALDALVSENGALAWTLRGRWQCSHCANRPGPFSWRCGQCRRWNTLRMETGIEPPPMPSRERRASPRGPRRDGLLGASTDGALPAPTLDAGLSDAELASAGTRRSLLGRVGGWVSGVLRRDGA